MDVFLCDLTQQLGVDGIKSLASSMGRTIQGFYCLVPQLDNLPTAS